MDAALSPSAILWLSFGLGVVFGAVGNRTHFCTMGAVADIVNMGDWSRMRMWLLAIAVAILGSSALHGAGLVDLGKSLYRTPNLVWLSHLVGGACFGIGMVLASGCGSKTLIRLGGGNLKSLVVFCVLGLSAYMTLRGILARPRMDLLDKAVLYLPQGQDIPALLAAGTGLDPGTALTLSATTVGGGLLLFVFSRRDFLTFDNLLGGIATGLVIVAAWYVSGGLGHVAEDPETLGEIFLTTNSGRMESFSFVAPVAYTLDLLILWSDSSRKLSFGVSAVLGVIVGSLLQALSSRSFRWEGFSGPADTARHLAGALLMGFGGVLAVGCTIGQGISGFSTLALGAILTFLAIIAGAAATLRFEYWRIMRDV